MYGVISDISKQETIRCFSVPLGSVPELPAETCKKRLRQVKEDKRSVRDTGFPPSYLKRLYSLTAA